MRLLMFENEASEPVIVNPERVCWLSRYNGELVQISFGLVGTIYVKGNLEDIANRLGRLSSPRDNP